MQIQAVFESGMIRPLVPLELTEGELIEVVLLPRNGKEGSAGQQFEQAWITALKQHPDEASRAEDRLEAQAWGEA
jgi:predicted DNA-binding antitoxin AbrB/MazE fold protein